VGLKSDGKQKLLEVNIAHVRAPIFFSSGLKKKCNCTGKKIFTLKALDFLSSAPTPLQLHQITSIATTTTICIYF
jgi:hypothetical protein